MRGRTTSIILMVVLALVACSAAATKSDISVIYDRDGNALIAYGGAKDTLPSLSAASSPAFARDILKSVTVAGSFQLRKWKETKYGDGGVRTEFITDVVFGWDGWKVFYEAEGSSMTYWTGDIPQSNSDVIELAESWTFGGAGISVSFPGGVGVSGSGSTITWSGNDGGTGTHWYLVHIYSGYRAESWFWLTSLRQTSTGSHLLDCAWVSSTATDYEFHLVTV
jgi:hypothetical protein